MDEFKEIPLFPHYKINIHGTIIGPSKLPLNPVIGKRGYYVVKMYEDGKQYTRTVHNLLGLVFIPNPDNKYSIDHINNNRLDNRLENLRWATGTEQNINKSYPAPNSGHRNIQLTPCNTYIVEICRNGRWIYRKTFKELSDAIKARDDCLATSSST